MTPALSAILSDLDIRVVHPAQHRPFTPMQTAAGATLERILADPSVGETAADREKHLRNVLVALTESENNRHMLIAPVIKAVSRIMSQNPTWYGRDASAFLEVMDKADLAGMYERAKANKGVVEAHKTIAALLLDDLRKVFQAEEMERLL